MRFFPALTLLAICGCGGPPIPSLAGLYPVTGSLTQDGKPVVGGGILFVAEDGGRSGCIFDASVGKDGTFDARTSRLVDVPVVFHPGLPIGKYKVIYVPASDGQKMDNQIALETGVSVEASRNEATLRLPPKGSGDSGRKSEKEAARP